MLTTARVRALAALLLFSFAAAAQANNGGDPLFCQPQEGLGFLITNSGSDVFTADPDCYGNFNPSPPSVSTITTTQGGTLTPALTFSGINYVYTPPTPSFTGTDTFSIGVTTVWNAAGGSGSEGGTSHPGGPATLTVTLNVLPSATTMQADGVPTLVPLPAGAITGCTGLGNPGAGPPPGAVTGCVTSTSDLPPNGTPLSSQPSHGTLARTTQGLVYTPNAGYAGNDSFTYYALGANTDGSTALSSGQILETVTVRALPTVTVTSSVVPVIQPTQPFTLTGTVVGTVSGVPPTGTVSFCDGGSSSDATFCASGHLLCTAVPVSTSGNNAVATCPVAAGALLTGLYSITAGYSGDVSYAPAISAVLAEPLPAPALQGWGWVALLLGIACGGFGARAGKLQRRH